jgi:hypothetical protein
VARRAAAAFVARALRDGEAGADELVGLSDEWMEVALNITADFETSGNPWAQVTNDFDEQGISCGILQWNIGQGSLQPLVKDAGRETISRYMPAYGNELWEACHKSIQQALAVARGWQPGGNLRPAVRAELRALFGSSEMILIQKKYAKVTGRKALELAKKWAADSRGADAPLLGLSGYRGTRAREIPRRSLPVPSPPSRRHF